MPKNVVTTYKYELSSDGLDCNIECEIVNKKDFTVKIKNNLNSNNTLYLDKANAKELLSILAEVLDVQVVSNNRKTRLQAQEAQQQLDSVQAVATQDKEALTSRSRFSNMLSEGSQYV